MAWKRQDLQASQVGAGPYVANYNRAYDTHTEKGSNQSFAVNPPTVADVGPFEYSGIGPDKGGRAYHNPINVAPDNVLNGRNDGYLGEAVYAREIQTGNAPSGGYTTRPGLGFSPGFDNSIPDIRRTMAYRPSDWEHDQAPIHEHRDAETRARRAVCVDEDWATVKRSAPSWKSAHNSIEDSPYRRDWPDNHGPNGAAGSATWRSNPNKFVNYDVYDQADSAKITGARYNNGTHYSMAVHQTLTPYQGQLDGGTAVRSLRNTYRLDPQPWDTTNTDGPTNTAGYQTQVNQGVASYGTAWRLT